jgi:TIR domain
VAKKSRNPRPYRIFVSHATADKWIAVTLCEKLEEAGATTFRDDRDIDGGDDIPERIRVEIKRSHELIVLLTPNSIDRPWVLLEVGAAWGRRKTFRITPILCHVDVDPVPGMLKSKKAIPLNDLTDLLTEVKRRVKAHHE